MTFDDSALFHGGNYDAQKAHEYYLRTRKLKGRKRSGPRAPQTRQMGAPRQAQGSGGGKPNRADTKSRRAELLAQKKRLEARLDHLRKVLEELVAAAKKRSGGDPNKKKDEKDKAPETQADKADRNKAEKDRKPLTAKQKADKARKAKEAYEKEHPNSLSTDVEVLKEQVKDIEAKIQKAVEDARRRRNTAGKKDQASGSRNNTNDGPRGR